ncbi:hypothetical protein AB1399_01810 [Hydrogenibacillus schlegelii]|uniref:Protein PsiE n=1 Tax=Hydrogenibacillus schlegelii TaxID=1484 RepID=A0A132NB10_HYDSH|nr:MULTISPECIES: hypothetical protein [Hydrogenibacillus]KWX07137.1 hypothetical protein TR75_03900 [Hydrogenibacillus schlegelii]MBT9282505.1 hypothetical protein [Hydrogenibacillus schlegelii]OAR03455.1 hypothetical protein SA87_01665 [Hydrogenibacillus schlegelii]PTQ53908.1 MAG: hypothetical protein HSCHL_1061 [Hydrogenibacillus schlegelii]QZA33286.1 hypothetical protein K2M58_01620 [Hydrogenibacillus sp. N12]
MRLPSRILIRAIHLFEWLLAVIIIFAVLGEGAMMVTALANYILTWELSERFRSFLSDALLYLIGLEIALLLLKRDFVLIIDIMIFTIARKVIIQDVGMSETLIAVIAIMLLYGLKLYGAGQKIRWRKMQVESDEAKNA